MTQADERAKFGSVMQIDPSVDAYGGCMMIVEEVKDWGVKGYAPLLGGISPVRMEWSEVAYIGEAMWVGVEGSEIESGDGHVQH